MNTKPWFVPIPGQFCRNKPYIHGWCESEDEVKEFLLQELKEFQWAPAYKNNMKIGYYFIDKGYDIKFYLSKENCVSNS